MYNLNKIFIIKRLKLTFYIFLCFIITTSCLLNKKEAAYLPKRNNIGVCSHKEQLPVDFKFTSSQGHQVLFKKDLDGSWEAHVKEKPIEGFYKEYVLPVFCQKDKKIEEILNHLRKQDNLFLQKRFIHIIYNNASLKAKKLVYLGLLAMNGGGHPLGRYELPNYVEEDDIDWATYFNEDLDHQNTIVYQRHWVTDHSTSGPFIIPGTNIKGFFLEPTGPYTTESNINKRIPPGSYDLAINQGQKKGYVFLTMKYLLRELF